VQPVADTISIPTETELLLKDKNNWYQISLAKVTFRQVMRSDHTVLQCENRVIILIIANSEIKNITHHTNKKHPIKCIRDYSKLLSG